MKIGVLAVQGAFIEHERVLEGLGCTCIELRKKSDIGSFDGLVLPGGESTVQGKLLSELGMFDPLKEMIKSGLPVLATCAGAILLADHISNDGSTYFKTFPMTIRRNAYGRQLASMTKAGTFKGLGEIEMTFIRAPVIESVGDGLSDRSSGEGPVKDDMEEREISRDVKNDPEILARLEGDPVAVRYKKQLALTFHPELSGSSEVHEYFLNMINSDK
ncbi:MAG: pyridoxal 5'-phosphate synthase glutaminase subunit PdxT [Lachnospiraceae bacterium]|jgi:5'-phosphate synthase pdxT subunit|nr:pyridoxal 5'-phosphate synthase glutaminase subunit PdxT [Lachnospiraceae bacterium]MEE3461478.1 pyridoxal 5'-phosphate synthase glutaminase subunit PdxT [Lachnospiraceae bacterium]